MIWSMIFRAAALAAAASGLAQAAEPAKRSVELTMTATIDSIPEGAKAIDLWMPIAQDTEGQKVSKVEVVYPQGGKIDAEPRFGNKMWHKRFEAPFKGEGADGALGARVVFNIHRTEIIVEQAKSLSTAAPKPKLLTMTYLEGSSLVPNGAESIKAMAARLKLDGEPPIRAARIAYDGIVQDFTYNYKAPGAGKGDLLWACDAKTGDCSDYASVFLGLCRLQGIPADHEFGFPIRTKAPEGKILYYHCWPRFYVEGIGWIPLDISEADKHPELKEYNFGSQTADLMKFTHGRDVTLAPPQAGPPLNKFIQPYAEIDGKPLEKVKMEVVYKDLAE